MTGNNNVEYTKEIQDLISSGIEITQLPEYLEVYYKANCNLYIHGNPGIGKTQMVEQFVKRQRESNPNFGYKYFPLASMEPSDLIGVPCITDEIDGEGNSIKRTRWAVPTNLPTESNWVGCLYFDEFNNAAPAMQNAMQQLIQERRIGDYHLPKGAWIVAAGNPTENAYSTEMQAPVKDRFAHMYVKFNRDNWFKYMLGDPQESTPKEAFVNNMSKELARVHIVTFLDNQKQDSYILDVNAMVNNSYTFATPRSWERVAKVWESNPDLSEQQFIKTTASFVGLKYAMELATYIKNANKYQNPDEILIEGKDFDKDKITDVNGFQCTIRLLFCALNDYIKVKEPAEIEQMVSNISNATIKLTNNHKAQIFKKLCENKSLIKYLDLNIIATAGGDIAQMIKEANEKLANQ